MRVTTGTAASTRTITLMGMGATATGQGSTQVTRGTSQARTMRTTITEAAAVAGAEALKDGAGEVADEARAVVPAGMRSRTRHASACSMRSRVPSARPR